MANTNKWYKATVYYTNGGYEEKKSRTKEGLEKNIRDNIAFHTSLKRLRPWELKEVIYHQ